MKKSLRGLRVEAPSPKRQDGASSQAEVGAASFVVSAEECDSQMESGQLRGMERHPQGEGCSDIRRVGVLYGVHQWRQISVTSLRGVPTQVPDSHLPLAMLNLPRFLLFFMKPDMPSTPQTGLVQNESKECQRVAQFPSSSVWFVGNRSGVPSSLRYERGWIVRGPPSSLSSAAGSACRPS